MNDLIEKQKLLDELKRQLKRMPMGGYYDDRMDKRYLEIEISDLEKEIKVLKNVNK